MVPEETPARWTAATRVAFRFCVLYFGLYVLATQMAGAMFLPPVGRVLDGVVSAVGSHAFGVTTERIVTGSGDTLFDWLQAFTLLLIAILGATAWSILDGPRLAYPRLDRWFRIFLRFALGATLIGYGMVKVIPVQMPAPSLVRLLEPFGQFSPMGVLWSSIGASFPYERFAGSVELLAGVLLFVPRTATLGAIVALAATTQIFVLNMTYDVPVKLFSFHLVLMSTWLLAPRVPQIARAIFVNGPEPRWAARVQMTMGALLLATAVFGATTSWKQYGGAARPALYGIWTIDTLTVDGVEHPSLIDSGPPWRRVVIDAPGVIAFVRVDDTVLRYGAGYDMDQKTISLAAGRRAGSLQFQLRDSDHLVFDGSLYDRRFHIETTRMNLDTFPLLGRGFNWIQEHPINQ